MLLIGSAIAVARGSPRRHHRQSVRRDSRWAARLHVPAFRPDLILTLLSPALTVAMLGAIESLLSAVVADRMAGDRHDPNVELTAQGIANVLSPLFGGLPATGAIARTATNIRSGARTPVAGMTHAVTLLLILLFAAPLTRHIPLAMLAGILLIVSYDMGEWREIPEVLKLGPAEAAVWGITFLLTVLADLTVAVEAGMILAALALHSPGHDDDDRRAGHPRVRRARPRVTVCSCTTFQTMSRSIAFTGHSCSAAATSCSTWSRTCHSSEGGHPEAPQHDRHRCDGIACDRTAVRHVASEWPFTAPVRDARSTGADDGAGGVP